MNLGLPEMIFIFLLALIIFGPKKLPEIGRQIGKAMNEFKRASNEFKSQIEDEMRSLELEESAKRPPAPQILPPENTLPAAASAAAAENSHPAPPPPGDAERSGQASPDESVAHPENPDESAGHAGEAGKAAASQPDTPNPETKVGIPILEASEQAKAADV